VEAIRAAQKKYGAKTLNGDQIRWGMENLNIDAKRQQELGVTDMFPQVKTSCQNHEGSGYTRFMQWDGKDWKPVSGWIKADTGVTLPLIKASVDKYSQEKSMKLRDCAAEK
jgi:branched-chain amino acid transport system substrate-binding protein